MQFPNNLAKVTPALLALKASNGFFQLPPHLSYLHDKLLDVYNGYIKRLIVNMPPRHGKSELISRYFPAWYLMNSPEKRIILTTYEADFAASWGMKIRQIIQEYGKSLFDVKLDPVSNASYRFDFLNNSGGLQTAGVRGAITGKGADLLIIDDPVKNDIEAFSDTYRQKTYDWFNSTAYTRLEPNGSIIIVMTRWHHDDLVGRILKESAEEWEVVILPAIAGENDQLGRMPGEALWKDRYNIDKLLEIKNTIGSYWFGALYQQSPVANENEIFRRGWWQFYEELPASTFVIQSWDTGFKDKQMNDYSVCTTWTKTATGFYLVDMFRDKIIYPDLKRQVQLLYNKWRPAVVLIEDKASGQSLIQDLQRETSIPIKAVAANGSKEERASLVTPLLEAHKVFLPIHAQFTSTIIEECSEFPRSQHDDIVDSIVHALNYMRYSNVVLPGGQYSPGNNDSSRFNMKNLLKGF